MNPAIGWVDSLQEERAAWDDAIGMTITISADDNPPLGDRDFNDLIVLCLPEDPDLQTPHTFPRPDLTIPKSMVTFDASPPYKRPGRPMTGEAEPRP